MKPCKGCRYFRSAGKQNACDYYTKIVDKVDPISQKTIRTFLNYRKAENMRSAQGECGPDRKLYDTETKMLRRWIKNQLKAISFFGL